MKFFEFLRNLKQRRTMARIKKYRNEFLEELQKNAARRATTPPCLDHFSHIGKLVEAQSPKIETKAIAAPNIEGEMAIRLRETESLVEGKAPSWNGY